MTGTSAASARLRLGVAARGLVFGGGLALSACGGGDGDGSGGDEGPALPYARAVTSFTPGDGAGFGQDDFPDAVLGPPSGKGLQAGSLDVLSLGANGEIVLSFGRGGILDRAGDDFVVFENAFYAGGDPTAVFAEPGEVAVSLDGVEFVAFPCAAEGDGSGAFPGCAGVTPTLAYDAEALVPLDPAATGGDAFDLAAVGLERAAFVRIRDRADAREGPAVGRQAPTAGFDLDAVGVVHAGTP